MKKIIAIALALMLCVGMLSVSAFAAPAGLNGLAITGANIPGVADWTPADPAGEMTEVSESVYEITINAVAGSEMKIKFAGNDTWDDAFNFGSATLVLGETAELTNGGGSGDMAFTAERDMAIKFTVDLNPLASGGNATVTLTEVTAGGDDTTGDDTTGDDTTGDDTTGDDTTVEIDPNAIYRVAGAAGLCGSEWKTDDDNNKMTPDANGVYSITYTGVAAGEYEFKIAMNGSWDKNWGKDGENTDNVKITVAEGDDVTISFNPATGKISVKGATSNIPETGDVNMTGIFVVLAVACCGVVALVCTKKKFF